MQSAVWPIRLIYAGATFEMPDYCLLVVNSRRGRDLGPPRPDTFRRAVQLQGRATTRGDRRRAGGGANT